jgi:hypothetical protein
MSVFPEPGQKKARKRKSSADVLEELEGDWFNWVGHFGNSIRGKNGVVLAVSRAVNHHVSNEISYFPFIDRVAPDSHLCLICGDYCHTSDNKPSNACRHIREKHWSVTSIYEDLPTGYKNQAANEWKQELQ